MWKLKCKEPPYIVMSSDYSQQEPKMSALRAMAAVGSEEKSPMVQAFKAGKDIYSTIASIAFKVPYENCLEFNPETHEYQPDGKQRRTECKSVVLGINYGRSVKTIGDQLYGSREDMTDEDRMKAAQEVYDNVLKAFPDLRAAIDKAQYSAKTRGFTETILGRRRHLPDMTLPPYDFVPEPKYVNPDVDPLDPSTLEHANEIPERIRKKLQNEFAKYKYKGQVYRRTKELHDQYHIRVIDNTRKITDASRQCFNAEVQGSAADMTKMALLNIYNNAEFKKIGGRIIDVVHDECIAEAPLHNRDEAGKILSGCMTGAAKFMPFDVKCDVETTFRWYGNAVDDILKYPQPQSIDDLDSLSEDEVRWIQIRLLEMEYILPVYKNEDGSKPIGVAAHGVNGKVSDEMKSAMDDYIKTRNITKEEFIPFIDHEVIYGTRLHK